MVKFNNTRNSMKRVNREGGEAFKVSAKDELIQIVTTCLFGEPKFYGDVRKVMDDKIEEIAKYDPEFILKLASFTRNEMYLRTVSVYLLAKAATLDGLKETGLVKLYTPTILKRADELREIVACYLGEFFNGDISKLKLPANLKKGVAETFKNFDEYQFGKYNGGKGNVSFLDVMRITHPAQPDELLNKIREGNLATPYTWEVGMSEIGKIKDNDEGRKIISKLIESGFLKNGEYPMDAKYIMKDFWEQIIDSKKLPYMATLRNFNNFHKYEISSEHWDKVLNYISNEKAVLGSKQFPFRFYSVIKNLSDDFNPFLKKKIVETLNKALEYSIQNLPKLKGDNLFVTDVSGSMFGRNISGGSNITVAEIGCLMTSMASKLSPNSIAGIFGDEFRLVDDFTGNILNDMGLLRNRANSVGYSTHGYKVIQYLNYTKLKVDRVMIFTDEEMYGENINIEWCKYKKMFPKSNLYIFNLNGYGDSCVPQGNGVIKFAGWSDKIFSYIQAVEEGNETMVKKVDNYKPF